jgi:hypothetical protein
MTTFAELPQRLREIADNQLVNADRMALLDAAETVRSVLQSLGEYALKNPGFVDVYLFDLP